MRIHYDERADAMYIRFSESKYHVSEEVREDLILDLDRKGRIIGMEILHISHTLPLSSLDHFNFQIAHPERAVHKVA